MQRLNKLITFTAILMALTLSLGSQPRRQANIASRQNTEQNNSADSVKKPEAKGLATIEKFIKPDVKPMKGLTTVYKQDGKFFINVNDSLFGREIIMVTRISKAAEGIRSSFDGYAGDQLNSGVFRFERGPDNKIFLRKTYNRERSKDSGKKAIAGFMLMLSGINRSCSSRKAKD